MSVAKVADPVVAMSTERYEPEISRSRCRNLFGPIDHDQMRSELRDELRRIIKEKEERWNFDFVNQRPLDGDFDWQRIEGDRSVGFRTIASRTDASTVAESSASSRSSEPTTTSDQQNPTREAKTKANCMKTPERVTTRHAKPQRRSPRITDYLRARKTTTAKTSRQIKFGSHAGDEKVTATKQVRTSRTATSGGLLVRQSTLDQLLPKLRPRHANGKTSS